MTIYGKEITAPNGDLVDMEYYCEEDGFLLWVDFDATGVYKVINFAEDWPEDYNVNCVKCGKLLHKAEPYAEVER